MKISLLKVSNFLKLRDVEINPSHTNVIVGKNKQGKTSILKAIQAALGGEADKSAIRIGEDKAEITVELDDLIVRRTLTEKGSYLDVSNREGMKMPSPQKYLDGLIGSFAFNPVEFFNLKPAEQKKYLLEAVPMRVTPEQIKAATGEDAASFAVDWEDHALDVIAAVRKAYYDRRTLANADVSKKRKTLDELSSSLPEGFDASKFDEKAMDALREAIRKDELALEQVKANDRLIADLMKQEDDLNAEIKRLEEKREALHAKLLEAQATVIDHSDEVTLESARDTLRFLEKNREHAFTARRVAEIKTELDAAVTEAERLDGIVGRLTKELPERVMAEAKLPVEGLSFGEDGPVVNGVPLEHLSTSEQIRFALNVVRAMNAKLKIVLIDGIEALDGETFEAFLKEIDGDDYQYWVSRVDANAAKGIVIDDGSVKEVRA